MSAAYGLGAGSRRPTPTQPAGPALFRWSLGRPAEPADGDRQLGPAARPGRPDLADRAGGRAFGRRDVRHALLRPGERSLWGARRGAPASETRSW